MEIVKTVAARCAAQTRACLHSTSGTEEKPAHTAQGQSRVTY